jgi:hypothetical protein
MRGSFWVTRYDAGDYIKVEFPDDVTGVYFRKRL